MCTIEILGRKSEKLGESISFPATAPPAPGDVSELNALFQTEGLLIRQFDEESGGNQGDAWKPGQGQNFVSSAFVSAAFPYPFSTFLAGIVISNDFLFTGNPLNCACAGDCSSLSRPPDGCTGHKDYGPTYPTIGDMLAKERHLVHSVLSFGQ